MLDNHSHLMSMCYGKRVYARKHLPLTVIVSFSERPIKGSKKKNERITVKSLRAAFPRQSEPG